MVVLRQDQVQNLLTRALNECQKVYTQTHTDGPEAFGIITVTLKSELQTGLKRQPVATFKATFEVATKHVIGEAIPAQITVEDAGFCEIDRDFRLCFPEGEQDVGESELFDRFLRQFGTPRPYTLTHMVEDVL